MTFPDKIASALDEAGVDVPREGWFSREVECSGARFHSPTPLVVRDVWLSPDGNKGASALLCGTCADNLSVLQDLLVKHDGDLPWPVRREFGNMIRALALKGWEDYRARRDA